MHGLEVGRFKSLVNARAFSHEGQVHGDEDWHREKAIM